MVAGRSPSLAKRLSVQLATLVMVGRVSVRIKVGELHLESARFDGRNRGPLKGFGYSPEPGEEVSSNLTKPQEGTRGSQ